MRLAASTLDSETLDFYRGGLEAPSDDIRRIHGSFSSLSDPQASSSTVVQKHFSPLVWFTRPLPASLVNQLSVTDLVSCDTVCLTQFLPGKLFQTLVICSYTRS